MRSLTCSHFFPQKQIFRYHYYAFSTYYVYHLRLQLNIAQSYFGDYCCLLAQTDSYFFITMKLANALTITIKLMFTLPSLEHYFDPTLEFNIALATPVALYSEIDTEIDTETNFS